MIPTWEHQMMKLGGVADAIALRRFQSLSDLAWLPSDLTGLFTTATGGANPVPGDPVGFMANCAGQGGKSFAQVMAGAEDVKGVGVTLIIGSVTPATYDPDTGAGSVSTVNESNRSQVRFNGLPTYTFYELDVTNTGSTAVSFTNQIGASSASISAGVRGKIRINTGNNTFVAIASSAGQTATFIIHSVKRCPNSPFYQTTAGARPTLARYPKSGVRNRFTVGTTALSSTTVAVTAVPQVLSFKGTGTVTLSGASTAGPLVGTGANDRVQLTFTPSAGTLTLTVTGSVTDAQLELGSTATPYQKVTNTYDVTESGQPDCYGLMGDGLSKCMVTDAVTPNSDKVTVVTGVRKLSDAAVGTVLELSSNLNSNNGAFGLFDPFSNGVANASFTSKGTTSAFANATAGTVTAPHSAILTGVGGIGTDTAILRINGAQAATSVDDQGTGNFGNYAINLLARNKANLFFNGWFTGASITWDILSDADRNFIEKFIAKNVPEVTL